MGVEQREARLEWKASGAKMLVDLFGVDLFRSGHICVVYEYAQERHLAASFSGADGLEELTLPGTPVTDAGLVHLKGLINLSVLDLGGTYLTDAGMVHLKGLTDLSKLDLALTDVTDAGLVHLRGLKKNSRHSISITLRSPTAGWRI